MAIKTYTWPALEITASQGPTQFLLDGVPTEVSQDTVTPANSKPLPVLALDASGAPTNIASEETLQDIEQAVLDGNTQLELLNLNDFATETKQDTQIAELQSANTTLDALNARMAGSLAAVEHDEVVMTYVGATTAIDTVTYKLGATTVATLTMIYDGQNRLTGVVRS